MSTEVGIPAETIASKSIAQPAEISRRQFLSLLPALAATLAASACAREAGTGTSAAFAGYSIFRETMVEMSWPEVKKAAEAGAIVLLPIAVIEEHGPHMGLGADTYLTYLWGRLTRRALEVKGITALIAPPYYWGLNVTTGSFPGSFTVREETMKAVLYDIHVSLQQWGFRHVFSLNLHGDPAHRRVLEDVIAKVNKELEIAAFNTMQPRSLPAGSGSLASDLHAGLFETAWMAAGFPEEVNAEVARTLEPHYEFTPPGYYGEPAKFETLSVETIEKWQEEFAAATADWIEGILKK